MPILTVLTKSLRVMSSLLLGSATVLLRLARRFASGSSSAKGGVGFSAGDLQQDRSGWWSSWAQAAGFAAGVEGPAVRWPRKAFRHPLHTGQESSSGMTGGSRE